MTGFDMERTAAAAEAGSTRKSSEYGGGDGGGDGDVWLVQSCHLTRLKAQMSRRSEDT